jgi:hypothetical protein
MSIDGIFNIQDIDEKVTVGNGDKMVSTKVGSLRRCVIQVDGSTLDIVINDVKFLPELCANLFSVNKALKNGFKFSSKNEKISLTKGSASITFDRIIKSLDGNVSVIKMVYLDSPTAYVAQNKLDSGKSVNVDKFHEIIGNSGLDCLKKTSQVHGLKLKDDFEVCEDCTVAKARQKNLNKDWKGGSQVSGERAYLDIIFIRDESYGGFCFWVLLVDGYTDYCCSIFLKNKSDLYSKVMTLLTDLKIAEVNVKYIRCDDSGENKALFEACQAQGYGVKFEFSGPRTLQQNGKVERKFQTFFGRIRAMLNSAGLKYQLRSGVWSVSAMTVTYLSNITSIKEKMICPYQLLF